jgi:hypothetical protein
MASFADRPGCGPRKGGAASRTGADPAFLSQGFGDDDRASVVAVHAKGGHQFSKDTLAAVELIEGQGVRGDAHCGVTVKHRSRVARDPDQPNLRQVHLLHEELWCGGRATGFGLRPGQLGENITTRGIDLLGLGTGTRLCIGEQAIVQITGVRNPCGQIESFKPGLLAAVLDRAADGSLMRLAGVMAVVVRGGCVRPGNAIRVVQLPSSHQALEPV